MDENLYYDTKYRLTHAETKCANPIILPTGQVVSCGYCEICLNRKRKDWYIRNTFEMKLHKEKMFTTLTFDNEHIKNTSYKIIQNFIKRLKKKYPLHDIKYFGCYENGDISYRPHYHILIYGLKISNEELYEIWGKGFTAIGEINEKTINYICKYILKQYSSFQGYNRREYNKKNKYDTSRIIRNPFIFMSRGLGFNVKQKTLKKGFITHDGKKYAIPKAYKQHFNIKNENEDEIINKNFEKYLTENPTDNPDNPKYIEQYEKYLYNANKTLNAQLVQRRLINEKKTKN